jgi:hypothetical protein
MKLLQAIVLASCVTSVRAVRADVLDVGYFSVSPVFHFANITGLFAAQNIEVTGHQTASSPEIFKCLKNSTWPVILTQVSIMYPSAASSAACSCTMHT